MNLPTFLLSHFTFNSSETSNFICKRPFPRGSHLKRISYICPRNDSGIPNQNQESLKMTAEFQNDSRIRIFQVKISIFQMSIIHGLKKNGHIVLKIDARIFKIDARIFDIDARILKIDARIRIRFWRFVHLAAELRTPRPFLNDSE
jgi:hypothetical protein